MSLQAEYMVNDYVLIVRLTGELDHHEAAILRQEWQQQMRQHDIQHVILNLENLTFMDSSGIGVLLGRYKEIIANGGQIVICSINPLVERLLAMAGVFKIIRLTENETYALALLGVAS